MLTQIRCVVDLKHLHAFKSNPLFGMVVHILPPILRVQVMSSSVLSILESYLVTW